MSNSLKLKGKKLLADPELSEREMKFKNEVDELTEAAAKKLLTNIYRETGSNIQRLEIQKAVKGLVK